MKKTTDSKSATKPGVPQGSFPIWKTIKLGTYASMFAFQNNLPQNFHVDKYAQEILDKISLAPTPTTIDLVKVSGRDMGFKRGLDRVKLYARAAELGLKLVPAEVGPQLHLQYPDRTPEEYIFIGMEPIPDSHRDPNVFYVGRDRYRGSDDWYLGTNYSLPDNYKSAASFWIFTRE